MVPVTSRTLLRLIVILGITVFIIGTAGAFTANSLEITVDESGDAIARFSFSLEGMLENAIPQSTLESELMKGFGTSSEPPELISMDRSTAVIRMKKFAALVDVPTGTEYRTVTMNFKKAEIALQSSALSSVVTADFSPSTMKVEFPDSFSRQLADADVLPALTHIVIDPKKAAGVVKTPSTSGAIKILSSPEGTQVSIDGNYVGTAPDTFPDIPAGPHTLAFSKESYEPVSREVTVTEGQTIQVSVFLAYVEPTPKQAPGFFGVMAGLALALCVIVRIKK